MGISGMDFVVSRCAERIVSWLLMKNATELGKMDQVRRWDQTSESVSEECAVLLAVGEFPEGKCLQALGPRCILKATPQPNFGRCCIVHGQLLHLRRR